MAAGVIRWAKCVDYTPIFSRGLSSKTTRARSENLGLNDRSPQKKSVLVFLVFVSLQKYFILFLFPLFKRNAVWLEELFELSTILMLLSSDVLLFRGGPANLQNCEVRTRENRGLSV